MAIKEVLKPGSRRWEEFVTVLRKVIYERSCDNDLGLNPGAPELVRSGAKAIMEAMGDVDINASLTHFDGHGGFCDCEILWNVDKSGPAGEDDELDPLTPNEERWFNAAMERVKLFEPVRARVDSRRRIEEASRTIKPLLENGLTADELRAALKMLPGNVLQSLAPPEA
jgi:hypothetical protein